ncbi:MAG: aminotransferase class III-fold pyridoxal phosphate-dependent enzyme [Phenylobacterium sp.]
MVPHGLFAHAGIGPLKRGPDGRSVVDLQCGNGALLLGHRHSAVLDAARAAIEDGLNFSAGSEAEVCWAEAVQRLMPAAEQVRFTASGNEACALAIAVMRAVTGRGAVLVLRDHYFGWVAPALLPKLPAHQMLDGPARADAPITLVEAETAPEALEVLESGRVGGVIFEPTGGSFGRIPLAAEDARALNAAARRNGALCILDETITGFRAAPGGAQQLLGLTADLFVLGKVLSGGLPGGALAGRRELMRALDNRPGETGGAKVAHMGTGNGNPVVAAVGVATLAAVADGAAIARANHAAARLRSGLNALFRERAAGWAAYGEHSGLHLFLNPRGRALDAAAFDPADCAPDELRARSAGLVNDLRVGLLAHGLDINAWPGGLLSAAHDDDTVDRATAAFAAALDDLKRSGRALSGWGRA